MNRFGSWLIVLLLAAGVGYYYFKYVRTDDIPPAPTQGDGSQTNPAENPGQEAPPVGGVAPQNPDPVNPPANSDTETTETAADPVEGAATDPEPQKAENPEETTPAKLFLKAMRAEQNGNDDAMDLYEAVVEQAPTSDEAVQAAAKLGVHYYNQREAGKAVKYLQAALSGKLVQGQREDLQKKLDELSADLVFDPDVNSRCLWYIVKPGDSLSRIADKYDVPWQLLQKINLKKNSNIRVDERLKVVKGPFDVVVEKSNFKLSIYLGNKYVKSYKVGLGKQNSTPVGTFTVQSKLKEPVWYKPDGGVVPYGDPENALGTRWIGFSKGYGIHGTWEPESIGSMCSEGCVRMRNEDVEEVFTYLVRDKSKVTIKK